MHSNVDAMIVDGNNWREIDRELRSIAKRQRALDAEEAALLCVVARQQIWRQFGCATMLEYLEMIFGYGPKVGHERVRVAMAIEALPELRDALANGDVSYSALRELTRVVTPNTQREWLDAVRGKSVRQVEDLVRTHRKGDLPTDPADPDLKPRRLQFEVSTATDALLRQARQSLANERGRFIEDDEFLAAMAAALLEGGANDNDQGRAKFQIRVTTCDSCTATYFEGGGRKIAVNDADAARADCDAQRIGEDERAAQDIAPKTRREVLHRDGGRCTVPGCRSARFIEVHHIVPRSRGGSHHASSLTCLCDGHHKALHEGKLLLSGSAPNIIVRFVHDPHLETPARVSHVEMRHVETASRALIAAQAQTHVSAGHAEMTTAPHVETHVTARHVGPTSTASVYSTAVMRAEARQALQKLGFKPPISNKCVDAALASRPAPTTLEQLIRAALKHALIGTSTVTLAAPESMSRGHR
jgi:5-methylcytosine-specific restriction endonuclease McrA